MSFIVGDEIITEEVPVELEPIMSRLKDRTREKSRVLMKTIANSDKFISYIIPEAGMVLFADEIKEDRKIFRYLVSKNGELYIDNKQRNGDMFCPLFTALEQQIKETAGRESETVSDDKEYRIYDKFMPKIVEAINQVMLNSPEVF